ncbi:Heparan sulfate (glucosamine) 3-O-sulfotransferase [Mactra antiquata]
MEKTPGYFYGNTTALRIKQMNENTKIIMIFKDPVEVAISIYAMWKAHKRPEVDGKNFVGMVTVTDENGKLKVNESSKIIQLCKYVLHAKTWIDIFGKKQVYAIDGSSFEVHPFKELKLLENFLNIKDFFRNDHFTFSKTKKKFCFSETSNDVQCLPPSKGRDHPNVSEEVKSLLKDYLKPFNERFVNLVNRTFVWS